MIQNLNDYHNDVMARGTPQAKMLLGMEEMFAGTEAKVIMAKFFPSAIDGNASSVKDDLYWIQERLVCLLISHRGQVLANFVMECSTGTPMNQDGAVVVPGEMLKDPQL
jgi:hypothetical protein